MKSYIEYTGLTSKEAAESLEEYGKNSVLEKKKDSLLKVFLSQFKSPLIYVLLVVAIITFSLKDYSDSVVVILVVTINAIIGTIQNRRTNDTLTALRKLSKPFSQVFRDGVLKKVHTENIVVHDIVFLEPGDIVPADGYILHSSEIKINESQFSGESLPVFKQIEDQVYKGTTVYSGSATCKITKTGINTEIGKLSQEVSEHVYQLSTLEKHINKLIRFILLVIFCVSSLLLVFSLVKGIDFLTTFKIVVALAVSAIPEGLPVVLTLVLALGAWRLSKVNSLLKNLPSGASLATVSFVCTDKTGTLTKGDITLEEIIEFNEEPTVVKQYIYASLDIKRIGDEIVGDILDKKVYEKIQGDIFWLETKESPFTSENKFNAKEYKIDDQSYVQIYKGAPELFSLDSTTYEKYTTEGKRVLCVGVRKSNQPKEFLIHEAMPVALLIFEDELRLDVFEAVSDIKNTGIKVLLITGDNVLTATHIAKKVGILVGVGTELVFDGSQIDSLSLDELEKIVQDIKVVARAKPEHKLKIVRALQKKGEIVAMTGDGVNDGPALSLADIGIAMGRTGTEVAKEASDLILVDDNFSSITKGIFEARVIVENIKKTIIFLLATSLGEIIIIAGSILGGLPVPLLPAQILWLNLITDGFLDIAIANEKAEEMVKKQNYKRYQKGVLDMYDIKRILIMGATMGVVSIGVFIYAIKSFSIEFSRTFMLVLMSIFQWFNAFNVRRHFDTLFSFNIFSNLFISFALILEFSLLLFSVYTKYGQTLLKTQNIPIKFFGVAMLLSVSILVSDSIAKYLLKPQKTD